MTQIARLIRSEWLSATSPSPLGERDPVTFDELAGHAADDRGGSLT